jgi:hypothetical protein
VVATLVVLLLLIKAASTGVRGSDGETLLVREDAREAGFERLKRKVRMGETFKMLKSLKVHSPS